MYCVSEGLNIPSPLVYCLDIESIPEFDSLAARPTPVLVSTPLGYSFHSNILPTVSPKSAVGIGNVPRGLGN